MSRSGLFQEKSLTRGTWIRGLMVFCLLFATVRPWNLPVPFLEKEAMTQTTQNGLGLPANEEESHGEKLQNFSGNTELIRSELFLSLLPTDRENGIPTSPFFEVPSPPPRS